ncbi:MAG: hypothetical protein ACOVO5_04350, partial [Devosia sp.]
MGQSRPEQAPATDHHGHRRRRNPAQFSPSGYMEARGKVLDACVAGIVAKAMGTGTQTAEADAPTASPVASGELPKGAVIKP